ncbi:MAG: pseudouridine synthase [Phascolarctobacterium faecium]
MAVLYNYVVHYYKQQGLLHNIHPVSRLDRNTSGLVIFAKEPRIQFLLSSRGHKKTLNHRNIAIGSI